MDLATLIVVVLVVLAIGAMWLGATMGVPGTIKPLPKPKLAPAVADGGIRTGQYGQEAYGRDAARAVAARRLNPRGLPDDSPGIQLKVMAGVVTSALIIVVIGAYIIWEPAREAYAADRQMTENVDSAAKIFTAQCARCHGPTGTGLIGPNLHLQEFAARYKFNLADPADQTKMRTLIVNTITNGRPPTVMPTWGRVNGGPFNETQVSNLADLIMSNGWAAVVPAASAAAAPAVPAASEGAAVALIAKYGCAACHTISSIPGAVGTVGPNLSAEGSVPKIPASSGNLDNTPENMQTWILNAQAVKAGTVMPNFSAAGMSQDDAKTLADYIESLKPGAPPAAAPAPAAGAGTGPGLIAKYGCGGCHTISGVQGAVGTVGPNLSKEGSALKIPASTGNLDNTPVNLHKWIFNAPGVKPGIVMPNFSSAGMSDAEAQTIADYLETLK